MPSTESLQSLAVIYSDTFPLPQLYSLFLLLPLPKAPGPPLKIMHSCQHSWQPLDPFFFTHNGTRGGSTGFWQHPPSVGEWVGGSTESDSLRRCMKLHSATICETCQMQELHCLRAAATIPIWKQ